MRETRVKVETRRINNPTREAADNDVPLLLIKLLEGGSARICGGVVPVEGEIFHYTGRRMYH